MTSKYKIGDIVHVNWYDLRPLYKITNIKEKWGETLYDLEIVNFKPSKWGRGIGTNQQYLTDVADSMLIDRKKRAKQ